MVEREFADVLERVSFLKDMQPLFRNQDDQIEQLRIQNNELQQQLMASEQREAKLSKQVEDYRTKLDEVCLMHPFTSHRTGTAS